MKSLYARSEPVGTPVGFVTTRGQLLDNAIRYERAVYDGGELVSQIPYTHVWIALYNDDVAEPRWMVVPAKFAGYASNDVARYGERHADMSGSKALKALSRMGLSSAPGNHPARRALRDLAREADVSLRSPHRLLVLDGEDLPRTEAVIVNSILAQAAAMKLSPEARAHVASRLIAA